MIAHLRYGTTVAELYLGKGPIPAPDGSIHDWLVALCIPGVTIEKTLAVRPYEHADATDHERVWRCWLCGALHHCSGVKCAPSTDAN